MTYVENYKIISNGGEVRHGNGFFNVTNEEMISFRIPNCINDEGLLLVMVWMWCGKRKSNFCIDYDILFSNLAKNFLLVSTRQIDGFSMSMNDSNNTFSFNKHFV